MNQGFELFCPGLNDCEHKDIQECKKSVAGEIRAALNVRQNALQK
jgi:hypothetical protein